MNGLQAIEQRGEQRGIKLGLRDAIIKLLAYGMDKAKAAVWWGFFDASYLSSYSF